jgi:indole-3-glycerol phosphate synthase
MTGTPVSGGSVLDAIVGAARRSAAERARSTVNRAEVERAAADARPAARALADALRRPGLRVIAECKRRSPSRGILRQEYAPGEIAAGYERAGAAAISVLTEPAFFDGHLDHLAAVRARVDLPLLRKDFIVSDFQILEARAAGANAVLLIVAALEGRELARLITFARGCGLAALVEAHTADEVQRALDAGAAIVGVNSRNLRTLHVDVSVFERAAGSWPAHVLAVAESGIRAIADVERLSGLGYDAFLVGERFMTADDPGAALAAFLADGRQAGVR